MSMGDTFRNLNSPYFSVFSKFVDVSSCVSLRNLQKWSDKC